MKFVYRSTMWRDGLFALGSLLSQGGWLALEGRGAAASHASDIPPAIDRVSADWLSRALRARFPGVAVAALAHCGGDSGTTDRARYRLTYKDSAATGPRSVFVKLAPAALKTRLFVNMLGLGANEVRFYQAAAAQVPVEKPDVYHAELSGRSQRFALVMEDLADSGARFSTAATRTTSLAEIRLVAAELGRLHAAFWASPRFGRDLSWLASAAHSPYRPIQRLLWATLIKPGLRKMPEFVTPQLERGSQMLIDKFDPLTRSWDDGAPTLLHGDSHIGNVYFHNDTVGFLDWQCSQRGQGVRDLAYFICTSVETELRRAHEKELIALYRDSLARHGVAAPPSLDELWRQYRSHALYAWVAVTITAAAVDLQSADIVRTSMARSAAALTDLDSLALLERI